MQPRRFPLAASTPRLAAGLVATALLFACSGGGGGGGSSNSRSIEAPTLGFDLGAGGDTVNEGEVRVLRLASSEGPSEDLAIELVAAGTAERGFDYQLDLGPHTWVAGASELALELRVLQDSFDELDETIELAIRGGDGFELDASAATVLHLVDDDPAPSIGFQTASVVANEADGVVALPLQLGAVSGRSIDVQFEAVGTAVAGEDFVALPNPFVIAAGEAAPSLPLTLVQDAIGESVETLVVRLAAANGATIEAGAAELEVTLLDDDGPGSGPAVQALTVEPSEMAFVAERVGEASATHTLRITNDDDAPVVLQRIGRRGEDRLAVQLAPSVSLPLVLQPSESTDVQVWLVALETGPQRAELVLHQQPSAAPAATVALAGGAFGPTGAEHLANAGEFEHTDAGGEHWIPDWSRLGDTEVVTSGLPIAGTDEDALYQSARVGTSFGYGFELPNGRYRVRLHFAEIEASAAGARVFDVALEGQPWIGALDLFAQVGAHAAHVVEDTVELTDGLLEIDLDGVTGEALVSAIEVRSVPVLVPSAVAFDFGAVEQGQFERLDLLVDDLGLADARFERLVFDPTSGTGSALDFSIELDGVEYFGGDELVEHAIDVAIPAGGQGAWPLRFAPTAHRLNEVALRLEGPLASLELELTGFGGAGGGWGWLHPIVVTRPSLVVDYDGDGTEPVELDGSASHTHEPGRQIASWEWREGANVLSNDPVWFGDFALGETALELEVTDDNQPPVPAVLPFEVRVHPADAVPGLVAQYHDAAGGNPLDLLDAVPATVDFSERLDAPLVLASDGTIGSSPFAAGVLVRLAGEFDAPAAGPYTFRVRGGAGSRVEIGGQVLVGQGTLDVTLDAGRHVLDARFAVTAIGQLPLSIERLVGGQPDPDFGALLSYDSGLVAPSLHLMDEEGSELGGELVTLMGFGFHPPAEIVVEWGALEYRAGGAGLTLASVAPDALQLVTPPGDAALANGGSTGVVDVRVRTAAGTSASLQYEYQPETPATVHFVLQPGSNVTVPEPTALAFGPDGRLYVGSLNGELWAITYDENWNATAVDSYLGVSSLTNHEILGLAFDPFDVGGELRVTVSHSLLYEYGGNPPTGPSTYSGEISILTGPNFDSPQPLVTGLPVSNHDHGVNGMVYDNSGDLFVLVGGLTNAGVPDDALGGLPDSPLSGALLKAHTSRPGFDGAITYHNQSDGVLNMDQRFGDQVVVAPDLDVEVFAPGFRNPFDLMLASWDYLYGTDNSPNNGYGPASTGPNTDTGVQASAPDDEINLLEPGVYYGYANRVRGQTDARQNVYYFESDPSIPGVYRAPIDLYSSSVNGIIEYRSDIFGKVMRGEILTQKYFGRIRRHVMSPDRRSVVAEHGNMPVMPSLNIEMGPGGVILASHYIGNRIQMMTPDDPSIVGPTVLDITPWRAPASGGTPFVIGGENLGELATTSVTIGGLPATLTSVSSRRIHGLTPVQPSPTQELVDVVVTVGGLPRVHREAFLFLPAQRGQWLGAWRESPSLPEDLGHAAGGVLGGRLVVVGEGSTKTLAYDLQSGIWDDGLAQRPFATGEHAAEVVEGRLYLFGGSGAAAGKVQIFDPQADSWSLGADLPWLGRAAASATIDGRVHVAGGLVGSQTVADHAIYDPASDSWTPAPALPAATAVAYAAGGSDGARFHVLGGRAGDGSPAPGLDFVQVYDPVAGTWQTSEDVGATLAPMPAGRAGTGRAMFYLGELYVVGGETSDADTDPEATADHVFAQVQVYDPVANSWRRESELHVARQGAALAEFEGRFFVVGGATKNGAGGSSVVEFFSKR